MEEGNVILIGGTQSTSLVWSKETLARYLSFSLPKDSITLMVRNILFNRDQKYWSKKGFSCLNCNIVLFHTENMRPIEQVKTFEELYEQLVQVYTQFYGGKGDLESKIKSSMDQGLSREEAIHKLAEKEKLIEEG